MNAFATLITAAAIATSFTPAALASPVETVTMPVPTAGLDMNTAAGQKAMVVRINRVATKLCATGSEHLAPAVRRASKACRKDTTARAMSAFMAAHPQVLAGR